MFDDDIGRHKSLLKNMLKNCWISYLDTGLDCRLVDWASLNLDTTSISLDQSRFMDSVFGWIVSTLSHLWVWDFVTLIEILLKDPLNPTLNNVVGAKTLTLTWLREKTITSTYWTCEFRKNRRRFCFNLCATMVLYQASSLAPYWKFLRFSKWICIKVKWQQSSCSYGEFSHVDW